MTNEEFILENQNLIYFTLKKMGLLEQKEELFDLGMIGLIKGTKTYDSSKGTPSTHLYFSIRKEIQTYTRKKRHQTISLATELGENFLLEDVIADSHNFEEDVEYRDLLDKIYQKFYLLKETEKECLIHYFGLFNQKKETQMEIAKRLNISIKTVNDNIKKAMNKLRMAMIKDGMGKTI